MIYFALIGDLIDSKKLDNRYQVQKKLEECLKTINQKYGTFIVSQFSITLGDEFQALLSTEAPLFHLIDDIILALKPIQIRFGIGLGEIVTDINPELSIGADGPAYWLARKAINNIHQNNDYGNTQMAVALEDILKAEQINAILAAGEAIKADWRASQELVFETALDMDIYDEHFDQQELGQRLGLNASALSKRLKSSSLKVYFRTRKTALAMLQESLKEESND